MKNAFRVHWMVMAMMLVRWVASVGQLTESWNETLAGIPTGGKLPFARLYDKATHQWGLIEKEAEKACWAADHYLQGENLVKIAKTLGGGSGYW